MQSEFTKKTGSFEPVFLVRNKLVFYSENVYNRIRNRNVSKQFEKVAKKKRRRGYLVKWISLFI